MYSLIAIFYNKEQVMEGIANVAQQQQTHGSTSKTVGAKEKI